MMQVHDIGCFVGDEACERDFDFGLVPMSPTLGVATELCDAVDGGAPFGAIGRHESVVPIAVAADREDDSVPACDLVTRDRVDVDPVRGADSARGLRRRARARRVSHFATSCLLNPVCLYMRRSSS